MLRGEPCEVFVQDGRTAIEGLAVVNLGFKPQLLKHGA